MSRNEAIPLDRVRPTAARATSTMRGVSRESKRRDPWDDRLVEDQAEFVAEAKMVSWSIVVIAVALLAAFFVVALVAIWTIPMRGSPD